MDGQEEWKTWCSVNLESGCWGTILPEAIGDDLGGSNVDRTFNGVSLFLFVSFHTYVGVSCWKWASEIPFLVAWNSSSSLKHSSEVRTKNYSFVFSGAYFPVLLRSMSIEPGPERAK